MADSSSSQGSPRTSINQEMIMNISKSIARNRSRTSATFLAMQESIKEKQIRFKELRAARFQEFQLPQRHIFDMVSLCLGIDATEIMEGAADDDGHVQLLNSFLDKNGPTCILFFAQDGPCYPLESGRFNPAAKGVLRRVYLTKGMKPGLFGRAVAVYKTSRKTIDLRNITDVCYAKYIEAKKSAAYKLNVENCGDFVKRRT